MAALSIDPPNRRAAPQSVGLIWFFFELLFSSFLEGFSCTTASATTSTKVKSKVYYT